jgi:transposase InsO family protein
VFARHRIPEEVRSDNGPQYSAVVQNLAMGIQACDLKPRFPQSNGEVERGEQTVKKILSKEKDQAAGILAYRATPLACGRKVRDRKIICGQDTNTC